MKNTIIAIDGFSACGKSTLAKALASKLSFSYVDSGAMYRAVTLYIIENSINVKNIDQSILNEIHIDFKYIDGLNNCFLNGVNVETTIRSQRVSDLVSEVATISIIRRKLVEAQREMGQRKSIVMDGRDIGTVVFPRAQFKFFLKANEEVRAERRKKEFIESGITIDIDKVKQNLTKRDLIDSTRSDSPLRQAKEAILVDNSYLSRKEQLELILKVIEIKH